MHGRVERKRRLEAGELEKPHAAASKGYDHKVEWPLMIDFALNTAARLQEILKACPALRPNALALRLDGEKRGSQTPS